MSLLNRIIEAFGTTPTVRIQGRGRDPLKIKKGDRAQGFRGSRKFLGRGRTGRNKIKSRRRNNFKTYEARKILATRHGVTNALKKEDNKYVLTYGDIARLMRHNKYVYNQTLRRWLPKKSKEKDKKDSEDKKNDPYPNKPKPSPSSGGKSYDDEGDDEEEKIDPVLDKPEPFKFTPPEKKEKKEEKPDRLKYLQARIILTANGEPQYSEYDIIPDDIQFKIPDEQVRERMLGRELLWLKNRDKWVDYKGKDPNPLEKYKGTLGRAMLVDNGEYSFLDFEDGNLDLVSEKMEDLGYEYIDGDWVDTEEKEPITEAAGTSSTPANAGPGANSQGIAPFRARLGQKMSKRKKPERVVI